MEKGRESKDIVSAVRDRYGSVARQFGTGAGGGCCSPASTCCGGGSASLIHVEALYQMADVKQLPAEVAGISLGCGDPVTLAELQPGQAVLDLGSGGGIDCFLAAQRVGAEGHVIGVDMTAEMIDLARVNAQKMGLSNVEFRLGEIEHLPVADQSVDVILSNCVINLSPDKAQVFREAFRVLRPGGKLAVSDIVTRAEFPENVRRDLESWASCVAGAWVDREYVAAIEAAGFKQIQIEEQALDEAMTAAVTATSSEHGSIAAPAEAQALVYSARVTAFKPK